MKALTHIVTNDFGLRLPPEADEDEVLRVLTMRVTELLEGDIDLLLSYLYRLDVLEKDINAALSITNHQAPNEAIAQLILDRQKARIKTKRSIKVEPIDEDWEL